MLDLSYHQTYTLRRQARKLSTRLQRYRQLAKANHSRADYSSFIRTYSNQLASLHNLYPEYFI